jgi:hypothetical protein
MIFTSPAQKNIVAHFYKTLWQNMQSKPLDKSSESLPILLRPMYSTNYSDAFKYLIYRRSFVSQVNTHSQFTGMDPSVV